MKKLTILLVLCISFISKDASAFAYYDNDLLLIITCGRSGQEAVFDLGSVTNFLNVPTNTTITVTNWSQVEVSTNLDYFTGDNFALLATSTFNSPSAAVWATDAVTNQIPFNIYAPSFQTIWTRLNGYGLAVSQAASISGGNFKFGNNDYIYGSYYTYIQNNYGLRRLYIESSFTQAMSDYDLPSLNTATATLGANLKFPVLNLIPGSSAFFRLDVANAPLSPATKIGTFQINSNYNLTFTAGGGN